MNMLFRLVLVYLLAIASGKVMRIAVFYDGAAEDLFFSPSQRTVSPAEEVKNLIRVCLQVANDVLKQVDVQLFLTNHVSEFPWKHAGTYESIDDYSRMADESLSVRYVGLDYLKSQTRFYLIVSGNEIFSTGRVHADRCEGGKFTKVVVGVKKYRNEIRSPDEIVHATTVGLLMSMGMNDSCIVPDSLMLPECAKSIRCLTDSGLIVAQDSDTICGNGIIEYKEQCDCLSCSDCVACRSVSRENTYKRLFIWFILVTIVVLACLVRYRTREYKVSQNVNQVSEI